MDTTTPVSKPKPRPRPQVMKLTDAAAARITELTQRADSEIVGLRVGIKNGGCAGQSYTVEYAHEIRPTDEVVEDRGVKILVDPKAVLFLLGTEMDYKADKLQAQFIFNNPNQVRRTPGPITTGFYCNQRRLPSCLSDRLRRMGPGSRPGRQNDGPRFPDRSVRRFWPGHDPPDVFRFWHFRRRHQLRAGVASGSVFPRRRGDDSAVRGGGVATI